MRISDWSSDVCSSDLCTWSCPRVGRDRRALRPRPDQDRRRGARDRRRRRPGAGMSAVTSERTPSALSVRDVSVSFGGRAALHGVEVDAAAGVVTGLIGPNGAGKTTLFNVICGLQAPGRGAVSIGGSDVTALRSEEHTSELPSLMRNSYSAFYLKKKTTRKT